MKHIAITCLAIVALAACTAPATQESVDEAQAFTPTSAEPQGADVKKGAKNTYKGGCEKQLAAKLDAMPASKAWQQRAIQASIANENAGLGQIDGIPQIARTVAQDGPPMPTDGNYKCDLMFDVSLSGEPMNFITRCTDPAFEAYAIAEMKSVRFVPATVLGRDVERKGVVTDLSVCGVR